MASDEHHLPVPALLSPADPSPFSVVNPDGSSPFLFIGDHAGNVIPSSLASLGLDDDELTRHIAWDIGVGGLGERLALAMDAVFIRQTFSRLVVDCNRHPDAADAIAPVSDGTLVPGNRLLTEAARAARFAAIYDPYHQAIAGELDRRQAAGRPTVLIALHSFTPALRKGGGDRPWQIGILHDAGDARFAVRLLEVLRRAGDVIVGDNEPYRMDRIDHTVPRHAYPRHLRYAELEVRQDEIARPAGQDAWSAVLGRALSQAMT